VRVVYTSDLHTDLGPRNAALVEHLVAQARVLAPDVLVLAGDVADTAAAVHTALASFRAVPARRLYLPGNHDLYVEGESAFSGGPTSREKFTTILPAVAAAAGFEFLGAAPVWCGEVAFVGTPGWYDSTLRDPALDVAVHPEHYRRGAWRTQRAFDRGHVLWPADTGHPVAGVQPAAAGPGWAEDAWLCDFFHGQLDAQLAQAAQARALVAVVHVLPCLAMVQRGVFAACGFHDAYLGSSRYGERLRQESRLRAIVTGHLHRARRIDWEGVPVVASPVGRVRDHDLAARARAALGCIEIR
jgi:hypothetical protein